MKLYRLLCEMPAPMLRRLCLLGAFSGLASAASLAIINAAAESTSRHGRADTTLLLVFVVVASLQCYLNFVTYVRSNAIVQRLVHRLRVRISERLHQAELLDLETIGRGYLFTRLSECSNLMSMAGPVVAGFAQQCITFCFALLYMAYLSLYAFGTVCSLLIVLAFIFVLRRHEYEATLEGLVSSRARLFDVLGHLLDGSREIRLDQRRSDALFTAFRESGSIISKDAITQVQLSTMTQVYGDVLLHCLLGVVVFVLPVLHPPTAAVVTKLETAALSTLVPASVILMMLPLLSQAEIALTHLTELEVRLQTRIRPAAEAALQTDGFESLAWKDLVFSYRDETNQPVFTSGPLSLEIKRGELVFFVGGNGSGKSTLLKLLTGLYSPDTGEVLLDGARVEPAQVAELRRLYGAIFPDFHLFDRLYGVDDVDPEKVSRLISDMGLASKVSYSDGRFSSLKLSTGQRKRLALIELLLEDRPVLVLDEWAADQDAEFREIYYTRILPQLKLAGKTVLAVSHDDRWFHVADRVIRLELGRLVGVVPGGAGAPPLREPKETPLSSGNTLPVSGAESA